MDFKKQGQRAVLPDEGRAGDGEEISDGEAWLSGDCEFVSGKGGATLTCEGSDSLEDLKSLEAQGVQIMTCGTCLDYYGLKEKLAVGSVTNMYSIVETMAGASNIIKP